MTLPTLVVLEQLMREPTSWRYGMDLVNLTGLTTGGVYGILHRLHQRQWAETYAEQVTPKDVGRPPRIYYRLTTLGRDNAAAMLAARAEQLDKLLPSVYGT